MGSLFSPQAAPTPPTPPPSMYRDEVNGVEQVPEVQPDGSTVYVTRQLPLTAEQQARQDQLNSIMDDALNQMQSLSSSDYSPDAQTQDVLNQWVSAQQDQLDKSMKQRTDDEEASLAQRGLGDSSIGQTVRRQRRLDDQDAEQDIGEQKDELGAQIRSQQYDLQSQLYNVASSASDTDTALKAQAATRSQASAVAEDTARQASLLDYYNRQSSAQTSGDYSLFGQVLGTVTKPLSTTGGLLGSWLWR